ncbi:ATP-binding SpoIIE family protein phosphatase [Actinomadura miaoliensis]|uniref:PAS domain-containing protein n=1 Tax=Actinomadura miaoliensis TaxID=430685 RepID=A0ABP7VVH2_9ACTN
MNEWSGEGRSVGLVGAAGGGTETYAALGSVGRALRHMSDGFLFVEADGRIAYSNEAADRLLGSSHRMIGRRLWDVPAFRGVPELADRCRTAMADDVPADLEITLPGGDWWYRLRIIPVPDGFTLTITDISDRCPPGAGPGGTGQAADRAALMEQLTWALAEAVTTQDVVTAFADSVLPAFHASGLIIATVENVRLYLVGITGYSGELIDQLSGEPFPDDSPIGEVLRTRIPLFFESGDELIARYPQVGDFPMSVDKDARVFLPLIASGRAIGVGVLSFDRPCRLGEEERTLLTALSSLIAQALERARLYDAAAARARELQRDLLPRDLPSLPAVSAAAHYQPAGNGTEVGGDWYDIIPLSADRVALVIGDVMGHGLSEAATMGRLRTAVRTLSDLDLAPDDILDRLNGIVGDLGEDSYATCLYGIYDPVTGDFAFGCAGHPPPAVVSHGGTVTYLTTAGNPPLGAASPPIDTASVNLPDGSLLVLYTDGLVEAADRDIDKGMAQLARTLSATARNGAAASLETVCDTLTAAFIPPSHRAGDDAALLLVRTHRLAPDNIASWALPEDPKAAGQARELVRRQLAAWDLSDLLMTTELLVSELVGNVIRHAKGPLRVRLLRSRTLICEVSDGSLTTPLIRRSAPTDEGGRGLQLVAALAQRWGTRYTCSGKTIWTEQSIPD